MTTTIIIILSVINVALIANAMRQNSIIDRLRGHDNSDEEGA